MKYLAVFTDPLDVPADKLTKSELKNYKESILKYLPILTINYEYKSVDEGIIKKYNEFYDANISNYEEYFEEMDNKTNEALNFYDKLFSNSNIPTSHFFYNMESVANLVSDYMKDEIC